jgi:hypothetical protein
MSDTPRTDEAEVDIGADIKMVPAHFARQLERELERMVSRECYWKGALKAERKYVKELEVRIGIRAPLDGLTATCV